MNFTAKQISSLEKIRPGCKNIIDINNVWRKKMMGGEVFCYQIALESKDTDTHTINNVTTVDVEMESPIKDFVKVYMVKNVVMDFAVYPDTAGEFITKEPGIMPDILMPIEIEKNRVSLANGAAALWVEVNIPENTKAGEYPITFTFSASSQSGTAVVKKTIYIEVVDCNVGKQKTIFTQWFHVDCIADVHNVEVYSEEHWDLIDKYMSLARDLGINMILTPIITPPLDTGFGTTRPCTQLVKIEKIGEKYTFDFALLKRWVDLCKKNGMEYYEMAHLFSQGNVKYAPNILIKENGEEKYLFGWDVPAMSESYKDFLGQFVPAVVEFFKEEGIKDKCWFHISDEPTVAQLEKYRAAYDVIVPLIDGCRTFDAMSEYEFYETGLIKTPVVTTSEIGIFLENKIEHQWSYTACTTHNKVANRHMAMPSYRTRIFGLQMYKFDIEGYLQWGYNFYYSASSYKAINPYITTSSDGVYPSGDAFSVYPIYKGVVPSLRALVFKEALNDVEVCRTLEKYIGKEKVVEMIDAEAGMDVKIDEYPTDPEFVPRLIEKMEKMIADYVAK